MRWDGAKTKQTIMLINAYFDAMMFLCVIQ